MDRGCNGDEEEDDDVGVKVVVRVRLCELGEKKYANDRSDNQIDFDFLRDLKKVAVVVVGEVD